MNHSQIDHAMDLREIVAMGGWVELQQPIECLVPGFGYMTHTIPSGKRIRLIELNPEANSAEFDLWIAMGDDDLVVCSSVPEEGYHLAFGVLRYDELVTASCAVCSGKVGQDNFMEGHNG